MIKAIFFDIDGTLVSFKTHKIPAEVRRALDKLRAKGILLFTASGRHKATVNNLDGWVPDGHIGVNGGMCHIGDEIIYRNAIAQSDVDSLVEYLETDKRFPAIFIHDTKPMMNYIDDAAENIFKMLDFPIPPMCSLAEARLKPVYEVIAFFTPDEEKEIMRVMPGCVTTRWTEAFTDIVPRGSNKWVGISKVIERLGIAPEETMAFGDGGNDVEMLEGAGIGIAMGNASDEVKKYADYVTASVDDDGIVKALKHFGLL